MSILEGAELMGEQVIRHFATHYESVTTTDAAWTEIEFKDVNDRGFISENIRIKVTTADADISFSQKPQKAIHGVIEADEDITMLGKKASSVFVRRNAGVNAVIEVTAWR